MTFGRFSKNFFVSSVSILCIGMYLLATGESQEKRDDVSGIVKRVSKTLDSIRSFSCWFESEHVWKSAERTQHISGAIFMKKPYKLRVERTGHIVVVDGETVWTYLSKHNQVQISDFEGEGEQFPSPHNIFKRYADEREAVLAGEEEIHGSACDIIRLVSPDPDENRVTVWIDRTLHFPVKAVEETPAGDVTTHVLSDIKINEKMDNDVFTFDIPEGIDVVDMRE